MTIESTVPAEAAGAAASGAAAGTRPARRPAPRQAQGQWALGQREPLNPSERIKRDQDGLEVYDRIVNIYARNGFDSIDPSDLRARFRWWGLYTQRRPGIPGGQTALLEPHELDDDMFMLRIRIEGGLLTSDQVGVIADCAETYGRGLADITDRQNVQLHWIRIEDVPAIWSALATVGLSTTEACGDTPRNMLGCPLAGIAVDEVLDATPALRETSRRYVGDPAFSNLPRKFKTAISGCSAQCTAHEINDVSFVGVRLDGGAVGYDLWVGGGLSTNPTLAGRVGAFVTPDRVPEVWAGVAGLFRDYGYRRSRTHARLKFLVADWGVERFRRTLEQEYLAAPLPDGPAPLPPRGRSRDHVGVHRQKDGRFYVGAATRAGRLTAAQLRQVGDLADLRGSGAVRTTTEQKLVVIDVAQSDVADLVEELAAIDLLAEPSAFRRGAMACTGIEFCKLAIVETKQRSNWLNEELERRLPGFPVPLTINVNGCPNSCARFQVADIGLKGMLQPGPDGDTAEAFQVHLGGALGDDARFGRKLRGLKVPADELPDYIERLLRRFLEDRSDGEQFLEWVQRVDADRLAYVPALA